MPMKVKQFPGEPIVLVTATGSLNMDEVPEVYEQTADVADQWGRPIYAVYDFSRVKFAWSTVLAAMNLTVKKLPGSPTDERVRTIGVGTSDFVKTAAEAMGKAMWGGLEVKVFGTAEEALSYARAELANGG